MGQICSTIRSISPLYPYRVFLIYSAQPQQTEETVEMKLINVAGGDNHLCSSLPDDQKDVTEQLK